MHDGMRAVTAAERQEHLFALAILARGILQRRRQFVVARAN
jgi:hypothetical protein